ncbi:unnamed protein product, partial [Polarella glacialis]
VFRVSRRSSGNKRREWVSRRASGAEDLEIARSAAEGAKLELEAAKLRAEAEDLERALALERRHFRAREILGRGQQVSAGELAVRLGASGVNLADEGIRRVVEACRPGQPDAALTFEDLASPAFDAALNTVIAEDLWMQREKQREDDERDRKEAAENRQRQIESPARSEPVIDLNDDRSIGTRLLSCLAYLLPLLDVIQYGFPLLQVVPGLAPLFALLAIPSSLINAIPFGSLILFFGLSSLSNNKEYPRLLRFNLQQAVLLDVLLFIPNIIFSLGAMVAGEGGGMPEESMVVVFVAVSICTIYSVGVTTLLGDDPDGIPGLSNAAKNSIDRDRS